MSPFYADLHDRADRLRAIPLEEVLQATGAEQDRHDKAKWHTSQGVLSVTGAKFMNWHQGVGGGGAIDLVIHVYGFGFKDALDWLSCHFHRYTTSLAPPLPRRPDFRLPEYDAHYITQVRRYLVQTRGLAPSRLEPLVASGRLYADARGNAVFLLLGKENRPVGAELRGTTARSWRGMAAGSRKDLGYFSVFAPHATAVVLCESAIDAISCSALHPHCLCLSTSGARANPAWLPSIIQHRREVYCGFDSDPTGDAMAHAMIDRYPTVRRLRPPLHDWNDVLRSRTQR